MAAPADGRAGRSRRSTIERWLAAARASRDPVAALGQAVRRDVGAQPSLSLALRQLVRQQYEEHPGWTVRLHHDNLRARVGAASALGPVPSYQSVRRFMKATGLERTRRGRRRDRGEGHEASRGRGHCEVRSYEVAHVHGLWHADFHHGSRKVLTAEGSWQTPLLVCFLDDHSRLVCHLQWYLAETAECFVHGLVQAILKRGLPRALLTDNGSAMLAAETRGGLERLGIVHRRTLAYAAYQNAKQEVFWAQVEGRLLSMLEGVHDLTLALLNEATQAWVEMEYHRRIHSELGSTPLERYLGAPTVGRPSPSPRSSAAPFAPTPCARADAPTARSLCLAAASRSRPASVISNGSTCATPAGISRGWTWSMPAPARSSLPSTRSTSDGTPADGGADSLRLRPTALPRQRRRQRRHRPPRGSRRCLSELLADYAATGLPPAYLPKESKNEKERS